MARKRFYITTTLPYVNSDPHLGFAFELVQADVIARYHKDILGEELFFNTNAKTALIVGQARGVILLAAAEKSIPIAIYTPLQVKITVSGYGRADKKQVGEMVKILLKLKIMPKLDDITDALAVALTHAFSRKMSQLV